jgi:hypothetical protein
MIKKRNKHEERKVITDVPFSKAKSEMLQVDVAKIDNEHEMPADNVKMQNSPCCAI